MSGVPITIAAVPMGWGPEESRANTGGSADGPPIALTHVKAEILQAGLRTGSVGLAQHGFDHAPVGRDRRGRPAEFSGQTAAAQRERLARGLEILLETTGLRPRVFVPPWNRYDASTVSALQTLGFGVLSAGREAADETRSRGPLRFVPATAGPGELRREIEAARAAGEPRLIVGLLHPYDFVELGTRWSRLERDEWSELMHWIGAQTDVETSTLERLAEIESDLGAERIAAFDRYHRDPVRRLIPASWTGSLDRPLGWYPDRGATRERTRRRALAAAALWMPVLAGCGAVGAAVMALSPESRTVRLALRLALTMALIPLIGRVTREGGPYFRGLLVTLGLAALALGAWLS